MSTKTWTGSTDENWANGLNWNPNGAPTSADDVVVATGDAQLTNANAGTINSLTNSSDVDLIDDAVLAVSQAVSNSGTLTLDRNYNEGGSSLSIGGALTNTGSVDIGNTSTLTGATTVTAQGLSNTGTINISSSGATPLAKLDVAAIAGFGTAGVLTGAVNLADDALLEFASGEINSIAANSELTLESSDAFVADAGALTSNSALTGLNNNAGSLYLENGASIATTGALTNTGLIALDAFYNQGGSSLSVSGVLTNSGTVDIGNSSGLTAQTTLTVQGLSNTGTINISSSGASPVAELDVTAAAGFETAGVLTGSVNLANGAVLEFASGQIASIASGSELTLGTSDAFVADAGSATSNSALTGLNSNAGSLYIQNGSSVATTGELNNTGLLSLDQYYNQGGSSLSVGGVLTSSGTVNVGNGSGLTAATTLTAQGLSNTGTINIDSSGATPLAELDVTAAAGFGTVGALTGDVNLGNDALLEFASGQITSIATSSELTLESPDAFVADAGALTSNSALTGLNNDAGSLYLENGASISTTGALTNTGLIALDVYYNQGGSSLSVSGALTNSGTVDVGDDSGLTAATTLTAQGLSNTGTINIASSGATPLAALDVSAPAGFGTAGVLTGNVNLTNDALLEFASGQIDSIAANSELTVESPDAFVADAGALTSNSALTGLNNNAGSLYLENGATISATGALANTGLIALDAYYNQGGSSLSVGGVLTNSGTVDVGNSAGLTAATTVTAQGLSNTGTINIDSNSATPLAELNVAAPAGFGTAGVLTGSLNMQNDALLEFASGQINSIAANSELTLESSDAFVADTGALTSNSALTGLNNNAGSLYLENGASISTTGALTNTGLIALDAYYNQGGSSLSVGGVLTNSGTVDVGNGSGLTAATTATAQGLSNTGTINIDSNSATLMAELNVAASAGFGTAGALTGSLNMQNDALLEFASGQINSIAANSELTLESSDAFVADAGALTSNSALTGLNNVGGSLYLENGATISTTGALTNTGLIALDAYYNQGGSSLSVGGALTNSGTVDVGNGSGLTAATTVTAQGLSNTGTINISSSSATPLAALNVAAPAGFGTAGALTGAVNLANDALLEFASGQINSIAANSELTLESSDAFVADAGALTSNSALTGLNANAGSLSLENGASIATTGGLTNTGVVALDQYYNQGGSSLSVGGVLTNSGTVNVGNGSGLTAATTLTAQGLSNTGTININSNSSSTSAKLAITGAANNDAGTIFVNGDSAFTVNGSFTQTAPANLTLQLFGSGAGQYSSLAVAGSADIAGGSLSANLDGVTLAAGQSYNLATFTDGDLKGVYDTLYVGNDSGASTNVNIGNGLIAGLVYDDALGNIQLQIATAPASTADTWTAGAGNFGAGADWSNGATQFYSDVTIGSTGTAAVTLSNDATIDSLTLNAGDSLTSGSGTDLSIGTTLTTAAGSTLAIGGEAFVDGAATNNGAVTVNGSVLDVRGAVTGAGGFAIGANAELEFGSSDAESVTFNGAKAVLKLDQPAQFSGTLANMAVGDEIDLAGIVVTSPTVTGGTTLTFSDANNNNYAYSLSGFPGGAGFVAQSDGAGGTLLIVTPPTSSVTLNPIDGTNTINNAQAHAGVTVGGNVTGLSAGATFSLNIVDGAVSQTVTATVNSNGTTWSAVAPATDLTALPSGSASFTAFISSSAQASQTVVVQETLPTVTISSIDGNDVINQAEAAGGVTVSGTSTGLISGATFQVSVADGAFSKNYTAVVGSGGAWSATIPSSDATGLTNGVNAATISAQATDAYGNVSATATQSVTVEETLPTLTIAEFEGNNIINGAEAAAGVAITGGSTGLASGATFEVSVLDGSFSGGYTATVGAGGAWTATIPASAATTLPNGANVLTISAQADDIYGNPTNSVSETVTVEGNAPTVTINSIDGDDTINYGEAHAPGGVALSGTSTGLVTGAQFQVSVVDGSFSKTYTATVGTGGGWTATIPEADAITLTNGVGAATVSTQVTDAYGNQSALASQSVTVAETPPTISASSSATVIGATPGSLGGITIADSDPGEGVLTATLTDETGLLEADQFGNGVVTGDGTNSLTLSGSVAEVNAALASLTYTGLTVPGQTGTTIPDSLQLNVTDSFGETASATIAVSVAQAAQTTPVITVPTTISDIAGVTTTLNGVSVSDPYATSSGLLDAVTIALPGAVLNASGPGIAASAGAAGVAVTGEGTDSLTLTGTPDALNKVLLGDVSATVGSTASTGSVSVNPASGPYDFVDFTKTNNIQTTLLAPFPTGVIVANNAIQTPFDITSDADGNNFNEIEGTLTIPVNIPKAYVEPGGGGVEEVDMLTSAFNATGGATLETVEFDGVDGSGNAVREVFTVVNGQTVRDIFETTDPDIATTLNPSAAAPAALNAFTFGDSVGGATTDGGASGSSTNGATGTYTIDEQRFVLDPDFQTASLQKIIITSDGGGGTPLLLGITVRETPSVLDAGETGDQYDDRVKQITDPDPEPEPEPLFPPPPPDIPPSTGGGPTGQGNGHNGTAQGDVHITTYDGLYYNFQAEGEFVLTKSTAANDSFEVQVRLQPWHAGASVSVITQAGVEVGTDRVTFDITRPNLVWIDGVATNALTGPNSSVALNGGDLLQLSSNQYEIVLTTGETVTVTNGGSYLNVSPALAANAGANSVQGLLGADSGQANDFQLANGTVLSQPMTSSELYGAYADAWRVTDADSILDYGPGQTTATFTDTNFPDDAISLADLPQQVVAAAAAVVAAAGITDPTVAQGAELDYLATGDLSFVTSAAQLATTTTVAQAAITQTASSEPELPSIGVVASSSSVAASSTGATPVVFSVYLTAGASTPTVIDYAVIAPDANSLGTSVFGVLPSGQVTIPAGGTTGQITIDVPEGALGALASGTLDLQITSPSGNPVFGATAETTLVSPDVAPVVTNLTFSAQAELLGAGKTVQIALTFDEPVTVSGIPTLTLNDGAVATYAGSGGGDSPSLIFDYTPATGDNTPAASGLKVLAINTAGGSITNVAGVAANLTLPSGLPVGPLIDTIAPTITGTVANQTTAPGVAINPFAGVAIADGNVVDTDSLTITVGGSGGTLTGPGLLSAGDNVYALAGTAAQVTADLDAVSFTPTAGPPNTNLTSTFTLSDTSYTDSTATTDSATSVIVEATLPTVTIGEIDGVNVINYAEAHATGGVALSGTSTGLAADATFQVSVVDGSFSKTYTATVGTSGAWTATIPEADAITLPNGIGAATISAQATDAYGNLSAKATQTVSVEDTLPMLTISAVDSNNVINNAEAHAAGGVALSGTSTGLASGAQFQVSVVDGSFSNTYTATVGTGGAWTATVPEADAITLPNGIGAATISAQATDAYGNVSATASQAATVEEILPTLTISAVDSNNVIDNAEAHAAGGVALSGTSTGLASGAQFQVSVVDGSFSNTYTATVGTGGAWTATVPETDAVTLPNGIGAATISAQAIDAYGNVSAAVTQTVTVEETLPTLTITEVEGNNVINSTEAHAAGGVALSGTSTGLASGSTFQVSVVDGTFSKSYTATVGTGGAWAATIPETDAITLPNGTATVSAQATDGYGNVSATATQSVTVNETQVVTINPVDGDNIINYAEAHAPAGVVIRGTLAGAASGTQFSVSVVDGLFAKAYTATVGANGAWTADIPMTVAESLPNGTAVVTANVAPGDTATENVTVAETQPTFTAITDNPATGDLDAGKTVTITLKTSEAVSVSGAPTIVLNDGESATYDALKSTSTALVFDYTVKAGDNTSELLADDVNLNGGAITDASGNAALLSLGGLAQKGPEIHTAPPTFIGSVETPSAGDIGLGKKVTLYLYTSEAVTVTGAPTLTLNDTGTATYNAGASTSTKLAFTYTVAAGQSTPDLQAVSINLAGGAIDDLAGNAANLSLANILQTGPAISGIVPKFTAVTEAPATGDFDAGKTVAITLTASEAVTVTGAPRLSLNDGGTAIYNAAKSTSTSLVFVYTVASGQNTGDLQAAAVQLAGGSIVDAYGNAASLSLAGLTQTGPEIDTTPPKFTAITETPATGDLDAGKTVSIALTTSEAVVVSGTPTLTLNDKGVATYDAAASTSTSLVFVYTVAAGQNTADLKATAVNLAGGSIGDLAGNAATLSLAGLTQTGPEIDTTPPKFTAVTEAPAAGDLDAGKTVTITLTTSEAVVVSGAPTLTLNDNGVATYNAAASTSTSLVFNYTVAAGQNTTALKAGTINLNGGSIDDLAGNAATLSLTGLGQKGPEIDTTPPTFTAVTETPATGDLDAGKNVTIKLTTSEAVAVTGAPTLRLNDSGTATYDAAKSTATSLVFDYTVAAGQNTSSLAVSSVLLSGGSIDDLAGNAAVLSLTGLTQKGPQIDTTRPTVVGVAGSPSSGNITTGQTEAITVTLSEAVKVTSGPELFLNDGGVATYTSGSGTDALTFDYKALAGQSTSDLEIVGASLSSPLSVTDLAGNPLVLPSTVANLGVAVNNDITLSGNENYVILGASSEDVVFSSGAAAHLILGDSRQYTGQISGLAANDTLDLRDIGYGSGTSAHYSGTTTGGTLYVTNGTHSAAIALLGNYTGSTFLASSDNYGGVNIVDPPKSTTLALTAHSLG